MLIFSAIISRRFPRTLKYINLDRYLDWCSKLRKYNDNDFANYQHIYLFRQINLIFTLSLNKNLRQSSMLYRNFYILFFFEKNNMNILLKKCMYRICVYRQKKQIVHTSVDIFYGFLSMYMSYKKLHISYRNKRIH